MRQRTWHFIEVAGINIAVYATVRIFGYISNPRPYLWWHGLLDLGIVSILLLCSWLARREAV